MIRHHPSSKRTDTLLPYATRVSCDSSRRARAVEVVSALRSLGRSGLSELGDRKCRQARQMAEALMAGGAEILNDIALNQVIVAFGDDARTDRKSTRLNSSH